MNTTNIAHQAQLQLWTERFKDQKASGLKVDDWCSLNNFSRHQFYYWKHLLKDAFVDTLLPDIVPLEPSLPTNSTCLESCTTCTTRTTNPTIRISIENTSIEFSGDISPEYLSQILKAVKYA